MLVYWQLIVLFCFDYILGFLQTIFYVRAEGNKLVGVHGRRSSVNSGGGEDIFA